MAEFSTSRPQKTTINYNRHHTTVKFKFSKDLRQFLHNNNTCCKILQQTTLVIIITVTNSNDEELKTMIHKYLIILVLSPSITHILLDKT